MHITRHQDISQQDIESSLLRLGNVLVAKCGNVACEGASGGGSTLRITFAQRAFGTDSVQKILQIEHLPEKLPKNSNLLFKTNYWQKHVLPPTPYSWRSNSPHTFINANAGQRG